MNTTSRTTFRNSLLAMLATAGTLILAQHANTQEFPSRPVRIIVPYAAGAGADLLARLAGQKMAANLKQPFVVEARPGGDTMIGARAALQAPADGYTLLVATTATAIAPVVHANPGYRFDNLEVLTPLSFDGFILSVNAAVPARNLAEFITHVKANPGKLNQGSLGSAGPIELITDRFRALTGLDMAKIIYSGTGPALKDLAGGILQVVVAGPTATMPLVRGGHIRALGYTLAERNPSTPDIPTFKEQGFPAIVGGVWYALMGNVGIPEPVKQKISHEGIGVVATSDFKEKLSGQGLTRWPGTLQEFIAFVKSDLALWEADIKRSNLKPAQ